VTHAVSLVAFTFQESPTGCEASATHALSCIQPRHTRQDEHTRQLSTILQKHASRRAKHTIRHKSHVTGGNHTSAEYLPAAHLWNINTVSMRRPPLKCVTFTASIAIWVSNCRREFDRSKPPDRNRDGGVVSTTTLHQISHGRTHKESAILGDGLVIGGHVRSESCGRLGGQGGDNT